MGLTMYDKPCFALRCRKKYKSMASVMAKIEVLKAVGAEELVDQALAKVMQFEIDRLQQEQRRLKAELAHFEQSYRMTSEECQRKFDAGELGDAVEFFEWTSLYSIYQQNEHSLRLLEEKLV
jgi:hypothetical protein